jgi:hypothetical protein
MLSKLSKDCTVDRCQYCPKCHRKRTWQEWVLLHKNDIVIQLRLACPNGCTEVGTSFSEDPYKVANAWCVDVCQKLNKE